MRSVKVDEISAKPMDDVAGFVRPICTFLGLHRRCGFKVCRRSGACATRHVLCYQAMEKEMNPIVVSVMARKVANTLLSGENLDQWLAPAVEHDLRRVLAWEDEEIALIESGADGGDVNLTPYQLWLKNFAATDSRDRTARRKATRIRDPEPEPIPPDVMAFRHPGAKLPSGEDA